MALIRLNINSFKRDLGGIANRLVDQAVSGVEQRLENAVEDAFARNLNKIGISSGVTREISSRFSDSISTGRADDFFKSSTSEQNRVSRQEIETGLLSGLSETTYDAVQRVNTENITTSEVMYYPDATGEYYMDLVFQKYYRPSPQTVGEFRRFKRILLPIPMTLKEQFDLDVDQKAQGAVGGLADLGMDVLGVGSRAGGEFAIAYSFAAQILEGTVADALGQALGAVPNPHLQAIFSGVNLRQHTFQWTFAPRNPQESRNLKAIIHEMKKNSLPSYSTTGTAALQYPPMVDVKIQPWGDNLIKFKKCLVNNVSVNYAPAGLPSFFQGTREPTMIQLEIQLLETEIQTAKDYGINPGDRGNDGLQSLSDGIDRFATALGLDDELATAKQTIDGLKNTMSEGAQGNTTRTERRD